MLANDDFSSNFDAGISSVKLYSSSILLPEDALTTQSDEVSSTGPTQTASGSSAHLNVTDGFPSVSFVIPVIVSPSPFFT